MEITRLSTKGQVVLPLSIRSAHAWAPGTEFSVEDTGGGILLRPISRFRPTRLEQVAGCLKWTGKPKTIAQMKRAITSEIKARHDRGRH